MKGGQSADLNDKRGAAAARALRDGQIHNRGAAAALAIYNRGADAALASDGRYDAHGDEDSVVEDLWP